MAQFANPADIKKLSDWVARYGKYANVTLSETGEPIVLEAKKENPARVVTLPWNREGDVLTVLTNRAAYTQATVDVAVKRFADVTAPVNESAKAEPRIFSMLISLSVPSAPEEAPVTRLTVTAAVAL